MSLQGPPSRAIRWCVVLTMLYVTLIFLMPVKHGLPASYGLSVNEFHLAVFIFNLPSIIVWYVAFWAYARLHSFAMTIKDTKQGHHFVRLSQGIAWLAWSLPLIEICDRALNGIALSHPGFNSAAVIISNYVAVALSLISFVIIGMAARGIAEGYKQTLRSLRNKTLVGMLILLGIIYVYLILKPFDLNSLGNTDNIYSLPVWLMVLSVVIPYLYSWYIGLQASYELMNYSKGVSGVLYKIPLNQIVAGLVFIVLSYIASQYIVSVWAQPIHVNLNTQLEAVILFRILGGMGFLLIAVGAYKLRKIEQV